MPPLILTGLFVVLLFVLPVWPYSKGWGWPLAGMVGIMFAVALLVAVAGGEV